MMRAISALLALMIGSAFLAAGAAELSPQDFAYAIPIATPAPAAAYRVAIPLEVYRDVAHEDLRDLRVFNARGEVVPYELQEPRPQPVVRPQGPALPLFPLRADARVALDGVRVSVQSGGSAVNVQASQGTKEPPAITSYVIDARGLHDPLSALQLQWPDGAPDFSGRIRVESSDDLATWRVLKSDAPVLNLRTSGAQLVQSRLDLPATKAKFWRLTWVGKEPPFELTSVTADTRPDEAEAERSSLIVAGTPAGDKRHEFSFDLGANLPINRINIELPEPNSVAKMRIFSRARSTEAWREIASAEFYRVGNASAERHNPAISIPRNSDRFWLARLDQPNGTLGDGSPELQATWKSEDVVFLARGGGPFLLAYGSSSAGAANTALGSLLTDVTVLRAQPGTSRPLGGSARLLPAPRLFPWRMAVLWGLLGSGVVLLAFMAYSLSRELGKSRSQPP